MALNDGAGEVNAARRPIVGAAKIVTFLRRLARSHGDVRWSISRCNGLLTVLGTCERDPGSRLRMPTRFTLAAEVASGRIVRLYSQLVAAKLVALVAG